ncbi:hypothetical protein GALMADRAFT_257675 [Galerina marginata CBS 339.88]|uniref:F-box domain-containing protein n=1 Tax=Galerina marginata (strain CBS 339.88) TaxID=685588 RepID=A0A067SCW5_GALM3|nr:hypothetical protein GALMADRAFT_257675 [Galerina marginata CBS 339.88]
MSDIDNLQPLHSSNVPDPVLPVELEREIFEFAAANSLSCAATLSLVAQRVREWMEPFLYDVLVLKRRLTNPPKYPPLYEPITKEKLPRFKRATLHARHVLLQNVPQTVAEDVLRGCLHVVNLALWDTKPHSLFSIIKSLPIQRLSIEVDILSPLSDPFKFDHTTFPCLTHLDAIVHWEENCEWDEWENLALLPNLTHVAFEYPTPGLIENILTKCKKIRVFVAFYRGNSRPTLMIEDDRIVETRTMIDYDEDWQHGADGGEYFWSIADDTVATRQRERGTKGNA